MTATDPKQPRPLSQALFEFFGGFGLATTILVFLTLMTLLGTLNQVGEGLRESQRRYFESWIVLQKAGPLAIPLPGGFLLMSLLFVNLIVGGMIRIRKSKRTIGVVITHAGILLLLIAGFVKFAWARDGNLRLWPNETKAEFESFFEWELEISEPLSNGNYRQYLVDQRDFDDGATHRYTHDGLPFTVTVSGFSPNAVPRVAKRGDAGATLGPALDGFRLESIRPYPEAEANTAGLYAKVEPKGDQPAQNAILWGRIRLRSGVTPPWAVEVDGKLYGIELRKKRWALPFSVRLDKFTHVRHAGMSRAKAFQSDVAVLEDGRERAVRIEMNEPLRHKGFILFQTNWGPQDPNYRGPLYSVFEVVDNPSDQWPLWACIIIAIGLVIHFGTKLGLYVEKETTRRTRTS